MLRKTMDGLLKDGCVPGALIRQADEERDMKKVCASPPLRARFRTDPYVPESLPSGFA